MLRKLAEVCALALVVLSSAGCAPGKRPLLMVQMCLSDENGVGEFIEELKSLSSEEGMEFIDNSRNVDQGLRNLGHVVDVRVTRRDGMGIGASNLGLTGYQMAMGFSAGTDATEAREFANRTLKRIRKRWSVESVPDGAGARPMPDCR